MALRATSGPAPSTRSAKPGAVVAFDAKVENGSASPESVMLAVEDLKEGALGKPVAFVFSFDPPSVGVRPKGRERVSFRWTAALPEGKDAFTFRGTLSLRRTSDGMLVGTAPLDLYVGP